MAGEDRAAQNAARRALGLPAVEETEAIVAKSEAPKPTAAEAPKHDWKKHPMGPSPFSGGSEGGWWAGKQTEAELEFLRGGVANRRNEPDPIPSASVPSDPVSSVVARASGSGTSVPNDPGGGGDRTAKDAENERWLRELKLMSRLGGGARAQQYYEREGASKAGIGGDGLYDEAFVNAPARRQLAMNDLGQLQTDRAKELAAQYDRQAILDQKRAEAMQVQQQQDKQEVDQRRIELDKATRYYSQDLADKGKFWSNPGNVISAISYSLMALTSNDPAIGAKLINQAVMQDFEQRQAAANTTLGALKSNLDGYHKIAGDRLAGNQLALAESHRMAAQEIGRIGAKFSGPEAQKSMQIAIEDQKIKAAAAEMEFYAKYVHTPAQKSTPGLHNARYMGKGGWAPLGQDGPASPVNGQLGGGPTQAAMKPPKNPMIAAAAKLGGPAAVVGVLNHPSMAGKDTDADVEDAVLVMFNQFAQAKHPNNPNAAQLLYMEESAKLEPTAHKLAEHAGTRHLISEVRGTMNVLEQQLKANGEDPNAFLGWAENMWPATWVAGYKKIMAKDPSMAANKSEELAIYRKEKAQELRSSLAAVFNKHAHELFGGAQSDAELARAVKEISENSTFHQTQAFLAGQSQELQKRSTETMMGLLPMQQLILRIRGQGGMANAYLPREDKPRE